MAVHRKRPGAPRGPRHVTRTLGLGTLNVGGGDLGAAAAIIAREAQQIAASWSVQVPASISVQVSGNVATITADAPPARPAELKLRHPLFGDKRYWYAPPGPPFLRPASDMAVDKAMRRYAQKIDTMARKAGFR